MADDNVVKRARDMLTALHRNEKGMQSLAPIPNEFFETVQAYLDQLHDELEGAKNQDPEIEEAVSKSIRLVHKRVREIFTRRIEKVMGFAVTGGAGEEMENATRDDWEVYNSSRALVERYNSNAHERSGLSVKRESQQANRSKPAVERNLIEKPSFEGTNEKEDVIKESGTQEDDESPKNGDEGGAPVSEPPMSVHTAPVTSSRPAQHRAPERKEENIMVQAMEDIPPFAGLSRTYELKKGDVSFIPAVIANILIKRGLAERVDSK